MIKKENKNVLRKKRSLRVRKTVYGTAERPRLSVYRSLNHIYAQVINDDNGTTLVSASTVQKDVIELIKGKTKTEAAFIVGECVAKAASKKGITTVVFDRAGFLYTGRVKAVADGARSAGLEF
jgi:large subunit ribosomal protein L18